VPGILAHNTQSKSWLAHLNEDANEGDDEEEVIPIQEPTQVPVNPLTQHPPDIPSPAPIIPPVEEGEVNQNPPNNIVNPQPTMVNHILFSKGDSQLLKQLDKWNASDTGKTVKEWISEWQFTRRAIKWPVPQNLQANEQSVKQEIK
jgi:hypothetical protein